MIKMKQNISFQMKCLLGWLICSNPNIFPMLDIFRKASIEPHPTSPTHAQRMCIRTQAPALERGASAERKQAGIISLLSALNLYFNSYNTPLTFNA